MNTTLLQRIQALNARAARLSGMASRLEEYADGLRADASGIARDYDKTLGLIRAQPKQNKLMPEKLKALARSGIAIIHLHVLLDYVLARIDGKIIIQLPEAPGLLLDVLRRENGFSDDCFVPFKSHTLIADALKSRLGRCLKAHAITNLIHRLRQSFLKQNANPFWIETQPGRARLLLRKAA